jgi:hypothetical protein
MKYAFRRLHVACYEHKVTVDLGVQVILRFSFTLRGCNVGITDGRDLKVCR